MKRLEHVEAAIAQCAELGATFELENGNRHYIGVIRYNGKVRKTALSRSPSDWRVCNKVRKFVRQAIREMQG